MKRRIASILLSMLMLISFIPTMAFSETAGDASDVSYIAFVSDVHNGTQGADSGARLNDWISNIAKNKIKDNFEIVGACGDVGPGGANISTSSANSSNFWNKVTEIYNKIDANSYVEGVNSTKEFFVPGNHEFMPGDFNNYASNATRNRYYPAGSETGLVTDNYALYSFGATQYNEKYTDNSISKLSTFLESVKNFEGPIFILAHFPMHCFRGYTSGESENIHDGRAAVGTSEVITLLNNYQNADNVFFLWGHNHSAGNDYYDNFYDKINNTKINFTYCSAGSMSDVEYGKSGTIAGKGLVAKIDGSEVTLTYYGLDYSVVNSKTIDIGDEPAIHTHSIVEHAATAATCNRAGNTKYYECTTCNKFFLDKDGNSEIAKNSWSVAKINENSLKLSKTQYEYDGTAKKPSVTIKDVNGKTLSASKDYLVSYSNNKNVGTARATVTFKGNYKDSKSIAFKINPKGTSLSKLKKGKKKITVKWKKQSGKMASKRITGYQIQIALNSKFTSGAKAYKVKGYKKTSKTIKKLKAKKRYYVRVRTYYGSYYSKWSKVKSIKTK